MKIKIDESKIKIENGKVVLDMTPDELKQLTSRRLSEYEPGDRVEIAGYIFLVLGEAFDGTSVILDGVLPQRTVFDRDLNNWEISWLRNQLIESRFYDDIEAAVGIENIVTLDGCVKPLDGSPARNTTEDYISLLSLDEYRWFRSILDKGSAINDSWWLLTPETTNSNIVDRRVCCVREDGRIDQCSPWMELGVRPVMKLASNLMVVPAPQNETTGE